MPDSFFIAFGFILGFLTFFLIQIKKTEVSHSLHEKLDKIFAKLEQICSVISVTKNILDIENKAKNPGKNDIPPKTNASEKIKSLL